MKQILIALTLMSQTLLAAVDDNVIALSDTRDYVIEQKDGKMKAVKERHVTTYLARETDDRVLAYEFYGGTCTIDKASAPGAKPYYQTYEDDEIFYDGSRICAMMVDLKKNKPTKVTFELTEKNPLHFSRILLTGQHHTTNFTATITVPQELAKTINIIPCNFPQGMTLHSSTAKDGSITYTVSMAERPSHSSRTPSQPPLGTSAPQLYITGNFANVDELYNFVNSHVPADDVNVDNSVRTLAATLASRASTPQALIDTTAAWVRSNIRYYAIEHGDNAFVPATAASVLARRSGDCKGSANLIRTLLRINGIDGRLVWIGTQGHSPLNWEQAPVLAVGNHMIAAAVTGDSVVYLDGTQRHAFDGFLSPSLRGQQALIENGDKPMLRFVPSTAPVPDRTTLTADYTVNGDNLCGNISCTYQGFQRVAVASALGSIKPGKRPEFLNRLLTYGRKNSVANNVDIDMHTSSPLLTVTGNVAELGAVKVVADRMYIDLQPLRDLMFEIVDTKNRKTPYMSGPLYNSTFEYTIKIPQGYVVKSLPQDCNISNEFFDASLCYSSCGDSINCTASLQPKKRLVPVEKLEARNADALRLKQSSGNRITLQQIKN